MQRVTIGLLFFSTVMCEASRANLLIDFHGLRRAIHVLVNLLDVGQEALQGRFCDLQILQPWWAIWSLLPVDQQMN